ncbi:uncharacterized protein LOC108668069 [Hyalella azteca]|uniref:Uncharacterized protein LOC108668069 n=1 Tax=Hyalella azteca TaxID=294128 RepID=A0A8B7NAR6_HYAAZ|nr:uncharacterized protein LOC108668069 [Hyalella azteca]
MSIMMNKMKASSVVMHNVSDDAVNSSWHAELSTQMSLESCKVEPNATEARCSSPQETVAVYIKEEPQDGGEDIAVKEEPIDSSEKEAGCLIAPLQALTKPASLGRLYMPQQASAMELPLASPARCELRAVIRFLAAKKKSFALIKCRA